MNQARLDVSLAAGSTVVFQVTGGCAVHLSGTVISLPQDDSESDDGDEEMDSSMLEGEMDSSMLSAMMAAEGASDDDSQDEDFVGGSSSDQGRFEEEEESGDDSDSADDDYVVAPSKKERTAPEPELPKAKRQRTEQNPNTPQVQAAAQPLKGGVTAQDVVVGQGAKAVRNSRITVKYVGKLERTGGQFDRGSISITLGAGEVIKGWVRNCGSPPCLAYVLL